MTSKNKTVSKEISSYEWKSKKVGSLFTLVIRRLSGLYCWLFVMAQEIWNVILEYVEWGILKCTKDIKVGELILLSRRS
jgi:hypothetical protein